MNDSQNRLLGEKPLNTAPIVLGSRGGTNSKANPKPIVWHMFGHDIDIRIVDGVPHVNGARVEPADMAKGTVADVGATVTKADAQK